LSGRCRARAGWRRNLASILSLNFLFYFRLLIWIYPSPTLFNFRLTHLGFHRRRSNRLGRFTNFRRSSDHQVVALNFGDATRFGSAGNVDIFLPFQMKALDGPAGALIDHIDVGPVVNDGVIINRDVGHVNRLVD
jgi:hypothetical protein